MKRLLFLLIVAVTVGVMAGLVNAQVPPPLDIPVGTGNDAAEEHMANGATENNSSDLELGFEGSSSNDPLDLQLVGMRFNNITIPNGALIISAYIVFTVDETDTGVCNLTIFGDLSPDNPDEFLNADNELGNRPRTSAEVDWTDIPAWSTVGEKKQTPDISSIISEITSQAGWVAGNSLVLLVEPDADLGTLDKRVAESDEGGVAISPLLHVEYMPRAAWDPTPEDNGWALVDLPLLEWEMPNPLVAGDTLSVNVYFGTDPNLIVGKNGTIQPVDGLAVVNTGAFGRPLTLNQNYYWRVDVIDPNGGFGGAIITGETWTFTTTVPPEIAIEETDDSTEVSEQDRDVNFDTYTIALSTNPTSAVTIDIFENLPSALVIPITLSDDDAEEHVNEGGNIDRGSSDLELGHENNVNDPQLIGLYFRDIPISTAGAISSAYVEFDNDQNDSGALHLLVAAEKNAVPDSIGTANGDLSRRVQTDAKIVWDVEDFAGGTHQKWNTPDITAVIEEIVSDPDWVPGGNILILVSLDPAFLDEDGLPTGQQNRECESFSGSSGSGLGPAPVLYVNWAAPSQLEIIPSQVILTAENTPETITVKAIDDSFLESDPHSSSIGYTITTSDADYGALTPVDIAVTILENECGAWGFAPLDLNKDCDIDIGDLAVFAADFGKCTEPFNLNCNNLGN